MEGLSEEQRREFLAFYASGPCFRVNRFLASTPLAFDRVWRVDQRRAHSGVGHTFGDPARLSLAEQCVLATQYLRENHDALRALAQRDDVENLDLMLCAVLEVSPSTVVAGLSFPRELVRLAGALGLRLSLNVAPVIRRLGQGRRMRSARRAPNAARGST
jgi:hypothetical protein